MIINILYCILFIFIIFILIYNYKFVESFYTYNDNSLTKFIYSDYNFGVLKQISTIPLVINGNKHYISIADNDNSIIWTGFIKIKQEIDHNKDFVFSLCAKPNCSFKIIDIYKNEIVNLYSHNAIEKFQSNSCKFDFNTLYQIIVKFQNIDIRDQSYYNIGGNIDSLDDNNLDECILIITYKTFQGNTGLICEYPNNIYLNKLKKNYTSNETHIKRFNIIPYFYHVNEIKLN